MSVQQIRRFGSTGLLIELSDLDSVLALHATLQTDPLLGQRDVLAAAQTVLLTTDSAHSARAAEQLIAQLALNTAPADTGELVTVDVTYDGADLTEVAELTGLSIEAVIKAHTTQQWTAAFGGFVPGFAYLMGENDSLNVPRRNTPRTAVPAGSVALAGAYSAVYPRQSPGGWQLLGHTNTPMWDLSRENPALIRPQDRVQFRAVREQTRLNTAPASGHCEQWAHPSLEVLDAGLQSLFQDLGRVAQANLGVTGSGAADTASSRQANRLVGNPARATVIENLTGNLELRALTDVVLAVTGATAELVVTPSAEDRIRIERTPAMNTPFALLAGERLKLWPTGEGLRSYLAVRGGFSADSVLGSSSTDTLSGLGPPAIATGNKLYIGQPATLSVVGHPEPSTLPRPAADGDYLLRVVPGPRQDWFGSAGIEQLLHQRWEVSSESNRVGLRLQAHDAAPLARIRTGELASEGMLPGALQVPPSGLPVLFLADHPVTGGYPVIATVIEADLPAAAQLPPGATVRFTLADQDIEN
ncbi:carboxyltransferase domain-containing protein [Glutamicibacter uratoxydans]|uniref:5-oxoprolinase subunit B/C family protein n=1 Tax=Glutamicibacter uratoxydans TaxID=43667 RepID=UPI003D6F3282